MRYLLDTNVVREDRPGGNNNVRAWLDSVEQAELCLSVMTILEVQRGIERERRRNPAAVDRRQEYLKATIAAYAGRIIGIDEDIALEWGRLVGQKDKHRDDMALAATVRVRGLVLVTRNVGDFRGRDVQVLDPFKRNPTIVMV